MQLFFETPYRLEDAFRDGFIIVRRLQSAEALDDLTELWDSLYQLSQGEDLTPANVVDYAEGQIPASPQ